MRIAWVVYGALDQITGGYIYDRLVVERLRRRGDVVEVVSLDPAPRSRALAGLALAERLARLDPAVVVGDELCFPELGPAFAALPRRIARVLLVHHLSAWELPPGARRAALALAEAAVIRLCDAHLATSATTAARLRREHGLARVDVAPPGADRLPLRPRAARGGGPLRLTFVGSFIPRKGLLELLAAFERVGSARAALVLVGDAARDPAYAERVRRAIDGSARLRARVEVRGVLDDEALAAALAETDALVLPSRLEGYGMVLTEAVRAGVPVLAARAGAIAEVVQDGAEALLWDDGEGLVRTLTRFIEDGALRASMRRAAMLRAPALPTWDGAAAAVGAVLARAAPGR
ncbi:MULTISPECIES: glycosyltransferase family 4 protein [Sorangium]|uniref:Glycosyltransferase n=1 Tax=Sorangium cellulosum TaxID=56 RepID=A0A4P2QX89_SORCE|nr:MULTISPECIES: glycosyltransferase family 4 protein [Sorangium]AUX35055.1 glycosyltransferase [Sorangium cellulosum]WCQ94360.1 glycosyltransferase [Sorangium sp. Soce836]